MHQQCEKYPKVPKKSNPVDAVDIMTKAVQSNCASGLEEATEVSETEPSSADSLPWQQTTCMTRLTKKQKLTRKHSIKAVQLGTQQAVEKEVW